MKKISLKTPDILTTKVQFMGNVFFNSFSETETKIITYLLSIGDIAPINITPFMSNSIKNELNLTDDTLNVCLSRIDVKGAINKNKRIITFHPVFKGLKEESEFL